MKPIITHMSNDEERLVEFLRQHRPIAPPPDPDLEAKILQAIESLPIKNTSPVKVRFARRSLWLVSAGVAAVAMLASIGLRLLTPQSPSPAELASLEAFLETNWDDAINGSSMPDSANDLLSPVYSTTEQNRENNVKNY